MRVSGGASGRYRELVQVAVTQRLEFTVEPAPPYYALLGAHVSDLADVSRVHAAVANLPTHTGLDPVVRIRRLDRVLRSTLRQVARTAVVVLISGGPFVVELSDGRAELTQQGDFVVWGAGLDHVWHAEEHSVVMTVRWPSG